MSNSRNARGALKVRRINLSQIQDVRLVQGISNQDLRGQFIKLQPQNLLSEKLNSIAISVNPKAGTIRGLHFQVEPYAEEKIVSCLRGATCEVIVDIRPNSSSFGRFATFELSEESPEHLYIPKGIAHGFQTLVPNTVIHYVLTSQYSQSSSLSIDPFGLAEFNWPIKDFTISEKDQNGISVEVAAQKYAASIAV